MKKIILIGIGIFTLIALTFILLSTPFSEKDSDYKIRACPDALIEYKTADTESYTEIDKYFLDLETLYSVEGYDLEWIEDNCDEVERQVKEKLRVCPKELITNHMPQVGPTSNFSRSYFHLEGKRYEVGEFDFKWVQDNCDVKHVDVY